MIHSPCEGCPDRTIEPNCHMSCEKYLEFQAKREAIRKAREKDLNVNAGSKWTARRVMKNCTQSRNARSIYEC